MSKSKSRPEFKSRRGTGFGALEKVFEDVWWTWGTTRFFPAASFPRNMTIVREGDSLVVVHPVMMPDAEQKKIEALGKIEHIVRLGDFHGMDDALYVKKYGARVWAPEGGKEHDGAPVDEVLVPGGATPFPDGALHAFEVARSPETVIHLERHGGVLLTCDSVQSWASIPEGCSLLGGIMARSMGFKGRACIGPGWRKMCERKDGVGFGPRFRQLLKLEFRHLIAAHGPPVKGTAKQDLQEAVDRAYPAD